MGHPGTPRARRTASAVLVALLGAVVLTLAVAPLAASGEASTLAGGVVAALLLAAVAHLGVTRSRLGAHSAAARPPGDRALAPAPVRGRTTDPVHHPRRPRAPGRG